MWHDSCYQYSEVSNLYEEKSDSLCEYFDPLLEIIDGVELVELDGRWVTPVEALAVNLLNEMEEC